MRNLVKAFIIMVISVLAGLKGTELVLEYSMETPKQLHYSLNGIIDPVKARSVSAWLMSLGEEDKAMLHIETYGGHEVSAYKIMEYIGRTKGDVTCYVDSHAMSAGAMILSSCKKIYVTPRARVVFHLPRVGGFQLPLLIGKDALGIDTIKKLLEPKLVRPGSASYSMMQELMENCSFLTAEEMLMVNSEDDVTITGKQVMERLSK